MKSKRHLVSAVFLGVLAAAGGAFTALSCSASLRPLPSRHPEATNTPMPVSQRLQPRQRLLRLMEARPPGSALDGEGDWSEGDGFQNWFYRMRAYPVGSIEPGARARALEQAMAVNVPLRRAPGDGLTVSPSVAQPTWIALGPSKIPSGQTDTSVGPANPVSGRVTAIAVHPTNGNIVYVGGAQGGVWKTTNAMSASPTWTPMTDHEASLAVGAIAIDPVNPNIVYVGTGEPNGSCDSYYGQGVLRSADGGATWTLLSGGGGSPYNNSGPFVGKTIARILIDPATAGSTASTTIWAATTSGVTNIGTSAACTSPSGASRGLWKSTDSGATWTLQSAGTGLQSVKDMALDPLNHDVLYAGVQGSGVWKSSNAATGSPSTYTKLAGFPDSATASPTFARINLAIGGGAARLTLYAAVQASTQALWGLFKTIDGGTTWSHVDAGKNGTASVTNGSTAVTRVTGPSFVTGTAWIGRRILINNRSHTVSSVTSANLLVLTSVFTGTTSASASWSVSAYPLYCDGQCFYDMTVAVDPADTTGNTVYVGGNPHTFNSDLSGVSGSHSQWRSDDGGSTWRAISQGNASTGGLHTDDHVYAFDTTSGVFPRPVYDGNDGGIWRSADKGASWTTMNTNLAITQFSGVSTHPTNTGIVLGGTQDNGTNLLNSALATPPTWFHSDFGDGGQSLIDQGTPMRMLHTYFNQSFNLLGPAKVTDGGVSGPGTWAFVGAYGGYYGAFYNGIAPSDPVAFYAPLAKHPAFTPNVIYFGTDKVYRSADPKPPCCPAVATSGCFLPCTTPNSWTVKSPSLTKGSPALLSWIGVFPNLISGKEILYTGASDGRVEVSSNVDATASVATWTIIDKAPLPNRAVGYLLVSPSDASASTVYVGFSGFNTATPGTPGHVFKTTNGLAGAGTTWTDISGDLPDIPVNAIAAEPGSPEIVYVGTDIGVFRTINGGTNWSYLTTGFPTVTVFGLERNAVTGQIVAATHGRGMFQLTSTNIMKFFTVTPCRIVDTRNANGSYGGPALNAGANRSFTLTGQCGIPAGAQTVSLNLTVTQPAFAGFLTLYPGGTPFPGVSTINYRAGQTRANNAIVPLGSAGDIVVTCGQAAGTVHMILDVNGYFQ